MKRRYVIYSNELGLLLDFTGGGILWGVNSGDFDSVPTYKKKRGESLIKKLNKDNEERGELELKEVVADTLSYEGIPNKRASQKALANRMLVPDNVSLKTTTTELPDAQAPDGQS